MTQKSQLLDGKTRVVALKNFAARIRAACYRCQGTDWAPADEIVASYEPEFEGEGCRAINHRVVRVTYQSRGAGLLEVDMMRCATCGLEHNAWEGQGNRFFTLPATERANGGAVSVAPADDEQQDPPTLSARERVVLEDLYINGLSQQKVAALLGITRDRVRQIDREAVRKLVLANKATDRLAHEGRTVTDVAYEETREVGSRVTTYEEHRP